MLEGRRSYEQHMQFALYAHGHAIVVKLYNSTCMGSICKSYAPAGTDFYTLAIGYHSDNPISAMCNM